MVNTVSDLQQREQAISPEASFIVQAPAGSGKTELLIQRYLRLLSMVDFPEEIVAITFTRKSAAEMRGRILSALESTASQAEDAAEKTIELAIQARAQDEKCNWQLADNPGRLRIQTIDSLCAYLTRQMPMLARFGAQPETVDDARELYQQAAADTLAQIEGGRGWSDAIAVLLTHLDNDLPRVRNMLASMLAKRDQWLRHIVRQHQREELEGALAHVVEAGLEGVDACFAEDSLQDFVECLSFAAKNLAWEQTRFNSLPDAIPENLTLWQAIAGICLTRQDEWRKQVNKNQGFPAGAAGKEMKNRFQAILSRFSTDDRLLRRLAEIRQLPPIKYSDNEWAVVDALYQLLILAEAQLRILFAERNQIDFTGITQGANQALEIEGEPTDLALYLDYRIKHILLDEFQDISINQYVLLERLTAGWSEHDGHSLFLVGDPMQSIYRFREAEVGLFLNTWQQRRLGQVALVPLNIKVNFRSDHGIVNWVNKTFRQVLPGDVDISRGAVNYVDADAFREALSTRPVELHPILERDDKLEADTVLKLVQAERKKETNNSTVILVRNRSHLYHIVPLLRRSGLQFRAVEIESLGAQAAIQDLLALTQALNHFADRIAWLAILRAPWCGLTLADLITLTGDGKQSTVWECMQDDGKIRSLTPDGSRRVRKIRMILEEALAQQRRRRLSRWVESVWMSIGGPATLQDQTDLENTRTFFELLDKFDQGGEIQDRSAFVEQVTGLFAAPDIRADDSLQIMTIHKAKGLEFDTVILPGLSRGSGADEPGLLLWMELPHSSHQDLLLAPVKEAGVVDSPVYSYLKSLEREKQRFEQGRLLYVAVTRAKKQLHIIATAEIKQSDEGAGLVAPRYDSLLAQLWPVVKDRFEELLKAHTSALITDEGNSVKDNQIRRLSFDWQLPDALESVNWQGNENSQEKAIDTIEFEWASETIMHIGSVVHRYIQLIAGQGAENWDPERIQGGLKNYELALTRLGVAEGEVKKSSKRVAEALTKLLEDNRGRWILSKVHDEQRNEYAISGVYENNITNIIIDRTFIDDEDTRWIIDYKTSRHEGPDREGFLDQEQIRYKEQMEKYAALFSNMEDRPIKLGLYFPLLQGWREWKYES